MYSLNPSTELKRIRLEFADYETTELHDPLGRPVYTAVHKGHDRRGRLSPLVTAATLAGLAEALRRRRTRPADPSTRRLRDAVRELRDRDLLPDWRPPDWCR